jgi:hypothetical protein
VRAQIDDAIPFSKRITRRNTNSPTTLIRKVPKSPEPMPDAIGSAGFNDPS